MQGVQKAIHKFFNQFCPAYNESIIVNKDTVFPYITYSFGVSEMFENAFGSFQIWDRAENSLRLDAVADKVAKEISNVTGVLIPVVTDETFEYFDIDTGDWVEFELVNMLEVTKNFYQQYPNGKFDWYSHSGITTGALKIFRGSPFLQLLPINPDEREIIRYSGNIEIRSYLY